MKRANPKGHNIASNNFYLKCNRCSKEWKYTGDKKPGEYPVYTNCPKCHTSVEIVLQ